MHILFVANRFKPAVQPQNSASLSSRSTPGEFKNILISNFNQRHLKGYTTQKCTLEYLLDDQQDADSDEKKQDTDADEQKQDTDEQVKKKVDYDSLGDPLCRRF